MITTVYEALLICAVNALAVLIWKKAIEGRKINIERMYVYGIGIISALNVINLETVIRFIAEFVNRSYRIEYMLKYAVTAVLIGILSYLPFVLLSKSRRFKGAVLAIPVCAVVMSLLLYSYYATAPIIPVALSIIVTFYTFINAKKIVSGWQFNIHISSKIIFKSVLKGLIFGWCIYSMISVLIYGTGGVMISIGAVVAFMICAVLCIALYLLPTIMAVRKKHLQRVPIILINVLLGWSFIGWVVALVWVCMKPREARLTPSAAEKTLTLGEKLRELESFKAEGFITEEEYESKKKSLLEKY